jgi:hypothetical protein
MPATYEKIDTYTVTGSPLNGETGVTFSNIPQTYTDLVVIQNIATTSLPAIVVMRVGFNGVDANALYSLTAYSGSGATASGTEINNATAWRSTLAHTGTGRGLYRTQLMSYSSTTQFKSGSDHFDNYPYGGIDMNITLYRNAGAINTVKCFLDRAEFYTVGSTFTLYGIKAV